MEFNIQNIQPCYCVGFTNSPGRMEWVPIPPDQPYPPKRLYLAKSVSITIPDAPTYRCSHCGRTTSSVTGTKLLDRHPIYHSWGEILHTKYKSKKRDFTVDYRTFIYLATLRGEELKESLLKI